MKTLPVYVVSLKSASSRRAMLEKHLGELGIDYEFIDAVRGDELPPIYKARVNPTENMSPGQLGCYLSHVKIYERMIEEEIAVALILEDDAVLHRSVVTLIENGCESLDFDYCFLGSEDRGDEGYVFYDAGRPTKITDQHNAYTLSSGPYCTHAYLITLDGARKRLSCAYPARTAIDHYHFLPYKPRFVAIIPMLAFVNEESAVGSLSSVTWSGLQTSMRRYWWYYPLRDLMKLKFIKKFRALKKAEFPHVGHWKSFESTFKVVPAKRIVR